ncbi:MAG: NAD(+) synthase [Spirochaetaceae bacterium]
MNGALPFESIYRHGFARLAVGLPEVRVADVAYNVDKTLELARLSHEEGAVVTVFPELGLTAYTNDDLFQQEALLTAALDGLRRIIDETREIDPLLLVGMPFRQEDKLYNVAVVLRKGTIYGVVPKSYIPNYREFYEKRHFASGVGIRNREVALLGRMVPFGTDLLFEAQGVPDLIVHAEICEDIWVPIAPSSFASLAGATVLCNLSASNVTIGKAEYRRALGSQQSGRCIAAYLYSAAGSGESTTDLAWDGDAHIHENGRLLAEAKRFAAEPQLISADVHLHALVQDRMRMTSFADNADAHREVAEGFRRIPVPLGAPDSVVRLRRRVPRFPYVPAAGVQREERCFEAYNIQVSGLAKRLMSANIKKLVIGISGGLDSTQALIVSCRAVDLLGLPRSNILAYTMPGFATSDQTVRNARELMGSLGISSGEIDIRDSCMQMFRDIGHPFADGKEVYDVTFENVQAGERTSHLFRLANMHGGLVVGTGDLSELALGWMTYGVGDHMSHYAVNASVPKTLVQYLIRWVAEEQILGEETSGVLYRILDTEISPELVPSVTGQDNDQPAQLSEATIGPYELQDFHLYYISRYGLRPSTVAFLAEHAWSDVGKGDWPEDIPDIKRHHYTREQIVHWLEVFLRRFFGNTQFKRSCIPNGPKVGSGGSLSPRGDWRAPSDSVPEVWLRELRENVPIGD